MANTCVAVAVASWLVGCSQSHFTYGPAELIVSYWRSDSVVLVADGQLPGELPGWEFTEPDEESPRKVWDVRVAAPDEARSALGEWAAGGVARYVLLPIAHQEPDGRSCLYDRLFQDFTHLAKERARVVGGPYLVAFVPARDFPSMRLQIQAMGMLDDTQGYIDTLTEGLRALSRLVGAK